MQAISILLALAAFAAQCGAKNVYVSPFGSDQNSGLTSSSPVEHLSVAFNSIATGGDTVYLDKGTYMGTNNVGFGLQNFNLTVVGSGDMSKVVVRCISEQVAWSVSNSISISNLVFDGCIRAVSFVGVTTGVAKINIENVLFTSTTYAVYSNQSLYSPASYNFTNSHFISTSALYHSYLNGQEPNATVTGCTFTGHNSRIFVNGLKILQVSNSIFTQTDYGVIYTNKTSTVNIINSTFSEIVPNLNLPYPVPVTFDSGTYAATIRDSVFVNNYNGGAVYTLAKDLRIFNTIFSNNSVSTNSAYGSRGGAIYCSSGSMKIAGCAFIGNSAVPPSNGLAFGGAIYAISSSNGVHIEDSIFHANKAVGDTSTSSCGGGVAVGYTSFDAKNSVFFGNVGSGSAYCCFNHGSALLIHSILGPHETTSCAQNWNLNADNESSVYSKAESKRDVLSAWMEGQDLSSDLQQRFLDAV